MALADNHSNSEHIQYGSLSMFYTKQELVVSAMIEICLAVVGTFGNCIVCVAVLKNRRLQIASNFYMVSLAIADLLVTAILVPMRASQHLAFLIGTAIHDPVVHVLGFVGRTTILASISSLAALSNDRHAALKHPLKYRTALRYDKERAVRIILSIWLFSLAFTCVPLIPGVEDEVFLVGFVSFVAVVSIFILFAYGNILRIVRQSARWRVTGQANLCKNTARNTPCKPLQDGHATTQEISDTMNSNELSTTTVLEKGKKLEQDASGEWKTRKNVSLLFLHSDAFPLEKEPKSSEPFVNRKNTRDIETRSKRNLKTRNAQLNVFQSQLKRKKISIVEVDGKDHVTMEPLVERKLRRHRSSYAGRIQLNAPQTQLKRRKSRGLAFKINGETNSDCKNISEIVPPQSKIALKGTQLDASVPRIGRSKIQGRLRKMMFAKGASKSFQLNAPRTRIRERAILSLSSGNTSDLDFTSSRTLRKASQSQTERLKKTLAAADVEVKKHSQSKIDISHVEMNERKQTPAQPHKAKRIECQSSSRDQEIQPCSFKNFRETRLDRDCPRVGAFLARKSEHQVEWKTAKTRNPVSVKSRYYKLKRHELNFLNRDF